MVRASASTTGISTIHFAQFHVAFILVGHVGKINGEVAK